MLPKIFFSEFLLLFTLYSFSLCIRCLMERLVEQKSKEKAFKFLKFVPLGEKKKKPRSRGNSSHKSQLGRNCVICSQNPLFPILSHPLLSFISISGLLSYIHFFRLKKQRGQINTQYVWKSKNRSKHRHALGKRQSLSLGFLMPRSRMSKVSK